MVKPRKRKRIKGCFGKAYPPWSGQSETWVNEEQKREAERIIQLGTQGDKEGFIDGMMSYIKKYNRVDEVIDGKLPGYSPGVHIIDGKRVLITGNKGNRSWSK